MLSEVLPALCKCLKAREKYVHLKTFWASLLSQCVCAVVITNTSPFCHPGDAQYLRWTQVSASSVLF